MTRLSLSLTALFTFAMLLPTATGQEEKLPENLKITDVKVGAGPAAKKGDTLVVHYIGKLKSGKKFDSSLDRGEPFEFKLGGGMVIKGWDLGMVGLKVGGLRKIVIPPELGYGKNGAGKVIPPDAELHFDVELIKIK
jgi:FKBP-type peptidyl-prolyl cis-trans isomerase